MEDDGGYAGKVMAEHMRLQQVATGKAVPLGVPPVIRALTPAKPEVLEDKVAALSQS